MKLATLLGAVRRSGRRGGDRRRSPTMTQALIHLSSTGHSFSIVVTQSRGHVVCRENRAPSLGYQCLCQECQHCDAEPGSRSNGTAYFSTTPPIRRNVPTTRLPKARTHRASLRSAVTSVISEYIQRPSPQDCGQHRLDSVASRPARCPLGDRHTHLTNRQRRCCSFAMRHRKII